MPQFNDQPSYDLIYEQMVSDIKKGLSPTILSLQPRFEHSRPNRLRIYFNGISGSHYEICMRRLYHEFALHFESTPERSMERRKFFDPHLDQLTKSVGVHVQSGPVENKGWMRVWYQVAPKVITPELVLIYSATYTKFLESTFPILTRAYSI